MYEEENGKWASQTHSQPVHTTMEILSGSSILTLPSQQLSTIDIQRMVEDAVSRATQPLIGEINALRKENAEMQSQISSVRKEIIIANENAVIALENIAKIRKSMSRGDSELSKNRRDALRAILVANGGRITYEDAMKLLGISKYQFSHLIKTCDFVEERKSKTDKRKKYLILMDR